MNATEKDGRGRSAVVVENLVLGLEILSKAV